MLVGQRELEVCKPGFDAAMLEKEITLTGGKVTAGVVRVGNTVRRPQSANAVFVHKLLKHLEEVGFKEAPRFLGEDEQGREILTYFEGKVLPGSGYILSDPQLINSAKLIRRLHDATADSVLASGHEIVAHNDLGPHNTVFVGEHPVGIIDWDDAVPGSRLRDFANAVGNYVDAWDRSSSVTEQARRIALMCNAYGWQDALAVIDDIEADFRQALINHEKAERAGAVKIFRQQVQWMEQRSKELREHFGSCSGQVCPSPEHLCLSDSAEHEPIVFNG